MADHSFGLPRTRRLQRGGDFARIKQEGHRVVYGCLILNWSCNEGGKECRLGVVTSRRVGNAVVRNRARRLLREAFRQHRMSIQPVVDLVLIARNSIVGREFAAVERDYLEALRRAKLLAQTPGPEPSISPSRTSSPTPSPASSST